MMHAKIVPAWFLPTSV